MSFWALVAINTRQRCKTRLADYLSPPERQRLVRVMLDHVLAAVAGSGGVQSVAVVSPERDTLPPDVTLLPDSGLGLNQALTTAAHRIGELGGTHIVVLPADLPLIAPADIDALIAAGLSTGFSLAADAPHRGTNAIFTVLPSAVPFTFGIGSYEQHRAAARGRGLQPVAVDRPGLAFDVDGRPDLVALADSGLPQYAFLKSALSKLEESTSSRKTLAIHNHG